jgi:phytanoyl-CoA hydroxylase
MSELVSRYRRDGYLVVPDALCSDEVRALREEAGRICRGERGAVDGAQPPGADEADELIVRRHLCIHFPHKLSELMRGMLAHPAVVDALTRLIGRNIKAMQSMLFIKSEGRPGQAWHQDELFIFPYRDEDAVPVEVPAGSVVLFNGYLLHRSLPNSGRHGLRRALVHHYMRAESLLPWFPPPAGVTMGRADHRDIVVVAGTDPYAYKGTVDVMRPHVRPDGQGGCLR